MKLSDFSALCFDMDFTLVNYSLENFLPMVYMATARFLVQKKGYSDSLYKITPSDKLLMRQGLILDKSAHSIIDVSSDGQILSALIGEKLLSRREIEELYPGKKWNQFDSMQKTYDCDSSKSISDLSYMFFDTAFLSPVIPLIAKQIQVLKMLNSDFNDNCEQFYKDLGESFTFNYQPDNFKLKSGFYFPEMIANTDDYIEKVSQKLIGKLKKLRKDGINIILMTASHIDYTEMLMSYCYGGDWKELFDVICCRIKKPGFFSSSADTRPFYIWNEKDERPNLDIVKELNTTDVFLEGHWSKVDKWIRSHNNRSGLIAYVGDSFKSDILPTKLFTSWKLIAVVQEGRKFLKENMGNKHVSKKGRIMDNTCTYNVNYDQVGTFFGTKEKPTLNSGKLMEHSDLTISNIELLSEIGNDEDFCSGDGNFYDFDPFRI